MFKSFWQYFGLWSLWILGNHAAIRKYAAVDSESVLNVHVVPHSHDDVGWLKTVDQYYTGQNESITHQSVRKILTTTVEALLQEPARTFVVIEIKFFSMWWAEQTAATKDAVRSLVANQQLTFANGGWCMHDEAATHYVGMIDQTTTGHSFLLRELGVIPRIGWQLDPFGHSASQASFMTSKMGFDALYFGRIDYQDLALRHLTQQCEGLWDASSSMNDTTVFWGLTGSYNGNYGPYPGFCYDVDCNPDERLLGLDQDELLERLQTFLQYLRLQSDRTSDNHVMLTMGEDFHFSQAAINYANLDLLISSLTNHQRLGDLDISTIMGPRFERINVFYSSPDYYTQQKAKVLQTYRDRNQTIAWQTKTDDFFPYSSCENCFWTGYFTSRTSLKKLERQASSLLLSTRQLDAWFGNATSPQGCCDDGDSCHCGDPLYELEDAVGVSQHHDGVSGTSKQHVANDYAKRLRSGMDRAARHVSALLSGLLLSETDTRTTLFYCPLLNETVCDMSEGATASNESSLLVVVYNPLGQARSHIVHVPTAMGGNYNVLDMETNVTRAYQSVSRATPSGEDKNVLLFSTGTLPPTGAKSFLVQKLDSMTVGQKTDGKPARGSSKHRTLRRNRQTEEPATTSMSNGIVTVEVDSINGQMKRISTGDVDLEVVQEWGYYTSFDNNIDRSVIPAQDPAQNSGAYIFRPSTPTQDIQPIRPVKAEVINTTVGTELRVSFEEDWVKQTTRLFEGQPYVEIEYQIGPIPIDDWRGKEVVTRYATPIESQSIFYSDSNGREFMGRKRNFRESWNLDVYEPVAGNYFPVNAAVFLEDPTASLAVVVDRSQGATSLQDGVLELMVQRRTLADDAKGVGEPLNETCHGTAPYPPFDDGRRLGEGVIIRGVHRILVGGGQSGARLARSNMDAAFAEPLVLFGSTPPKSASTRMKIPAFTQLQSALPASLMLITFSRFETDFVPQPSYLLRIGHQYGVQEDAELSKPVTLDLQTLLVDFEWTRIQETTLSGNRLLAEAEAHKIRWDGSSNHWSPSKNSSYVFHPMEIRTFVVSRKVDDSWTIV